MPAEAKRVDYKRAEVTQNLPTWELVRDCVSGERAVKAKRETYLPKPNPEDRSAANRVRYDQYLKRAVFYGVTGRTLHGLSGMVFTEPPVFEVDASLQPLVDNADGFGETLAQQIKVSLETVLSLGRGGLLVDFPRTTAPVTRSQLQQGEVQPVVRLYQPESIINWRVTTNAGKRFLTLLVLEEHSEKPDDQGFGVTVQKLWRVYRRTAERGVTVEVWRKREDDEVPVVSEPEAPIQDSAGKPFAEIPFVFLGVTGNTEVPDAAPLYDLSVINLAHYRNSADFEESCFLIGQPTPFVTGVTESWAKNVLKGEMRIGSRAVIALPAGGSAGLLQAAPNQMTSESMKDKERQMVAIGARLVQEKAIQRTATEAGMERQTEVSVLAAVAGNVAAGYTLALDFAGRFVGASKPALVEVNTEFATSTMPVTDRAQLLLEFQAGLVTFEEARDNLRAAGVVWLDNGVAKEAVDAANLSSMKQEAAIMGGGDAPA